MERAIKYDRNTIFDTLQQHYMLIYIQNIQEFDLEDLRGLAFNLQTKIVLSQKQEQINQKLISISNQNYQNKKKMRKKKIEESVLTQSFSNLNSVNHSFNNFFEGEESFSIEQSFVYLNDILDQTWTQLGKYRGIIYEGNLIIKLPTKYNYKQYQSILFEVKSQHKKSSISQSTLKSLKIEQKIENITLVVAERQQTFTVNNKQTSNILGCDFLTNHKVIIQCNYRPAVYRFTLTFTS